MKILLVSIALLGAISIGCKSAKTTVNTATTAATGGSESLYKYKWTLVELGGKSVTPAGNDRDAHLLFTPEDGGRVVGSTSCNRLTGGFTVEANNKLTFKPGATTRMACPEPNVENEFTAMLGQVNGFSVADKALSLTKDGSTVAKFRGDAVK
ncbi:META domain-containing protein [Spirosoma montaniterrae]|uniref:DUF306 domain-containing protein n=1 Tax=Spirosoma montaniterrae TaxID=1178516 RepID=A0A1P9WWU9_9BACT|nr:META domain-containing protein [Spirosoma montaniterrae]AQG79823.1 hypothetical protein AWR27_11100 [Spirosoma montaniterrae]